MNLLKHWWIKGSDKSALKRLEEFIFPPLCVLCDQPRLPSNNWFCQECFNHIFANHHRRKICLRCSQNKEIRTCTCDFLWEFPFESIYSFLDYDEKVQSVMQHVKYFNKKHLAFYMGTLFSTCIAESIFKEADYIIAVPLHWLRKQKRGYNQAEWFARGIIHGHEKPILINSGLIRKKKTKTQVKLDRSARQRNVHGVFGCTDSMKKIIRNKSVILVDDVVTTGATTSSCAEALIEGGCRNVKVLSLARD